MILELIDVHKIYKIDKIEVHALRGINLKVKKGDYIALMGPSGSGKSTLLNIIGFLDIPTKGKYFFEGKEVSNFDEDTLAKIRNKKIGFVFQTFNLIPRLNAIQNVELPLIYAGVPKKERREKALFVLEKVGLLERRFHKPTELSGGENQRVAIARALIGGADLILADEPTGNLDTKTGEEIMNIFDKLNEEGKTIIVVTHSKDVAKHAKKIYNMKDGLIFE
ncbi:MAG: ABC transporter ATP-binding protein [candidate division WOR-3 bacterium]|uniref:ABC transporter ATP-binding protein n=1 Tax=candidate division WOR-3 bacterium TaxID=2052148 RepID=A0A7V4E1T6_UNCW3